MHHANMVDSQIINALGNLRDMITLSRNAKQEVALLQLLCHVLSNALQGYCQQQA